MEGVIVAGVTSGSTVDLEDFNDRVEVDSWVLDEYNLPDHGPAYLDENGVRAVVDWLNVWLESRS